MIARTGRGARVVAAVSAAVAVGMLAGGCRLGPAAAPTGGSSGTAAANSETADPLSAVDSTLEELERELDTDSAGG